MNKEKCEEFLKTGKKNGKVLKVGGEAYTKTMKECEELLKKVTIEDVVEEPKPKRKQEEVEQPNPIKKKKEEVAEEVSEDPQVIAVKLAGRLLVIVKDTSNYGYNCHDMYVNENCKNFTFEYSSGTSNPNENFRDTFLPILRFADDGYMFKTYMGSRLLKKIFPIVFKYVYYNLELNQHTKSCAVIVEEFLKKFITRFSCWRELQLSAALSGDTGIWNNLAIGRVLKEFALNYDFVYVPDSKDDDYSNNELKDPEQNYKGKIIFLKGIPYLKKRSSRLKNLTYDIPSIETLPSANTSSKDFSNALNTWLAVNKSLCRDIKFEDTKYISKDINPREEYLKNKTKKDKAISEDTTDTVYSGWERCN